jgi:dienelactone hydrolase
VLCGRGPFRSGTASLVSADGGSARSAPVRVLTILAMIAAALGLLTLVRYPAEGPATVSVSPQTALLDEPVAVSVRGLPARATAMISATAVDAGGTTWTASAEFVVSPDGAVTLDQPSLGGSYSGVNAMGSFQFMAPPSGSTETTFFSPPSGYDVVLQVRVGRRLYATATVRRQGAASVGVIKKDFRPASSGIYGTLFLPRDTGVRRPGVLVFGGSDGGLGRTFVASLLAAHGYPALTVAYFGVPGLPDALAEIPLEYFVKAVGILRAQPGVDPRHVFVMGDSRGGEVALLLGAYFPHLINGVIAGVPSSVVNPAFPDRSRAAWTVQGRGLPAVMPVDLGEPAPPASPQAVIPVEKIRGPILLSCGDLDVAWPSCPYTEAITRRLTARHFRYPVTALHYPGAGHLAGLFSAYFSLTDDALTGVGGTVTGTQAALADGHARLLAFLAAQ